MLKCVYKIWTDIYNIKVTKCWVITLTSLDVLYCMWEGKQLYIHSFKPTTLLNPLHPLPRDFSYLRIYGGFKLERGLLKTQNSPTYPGSTCEIMGFVSAIISCLYVFSHSQSWVMTLLWLLAYLKRLSAFRTSITVPMGGARILSTMSIVPWRPFLSWAAIQAFSMQRFCKGQNSCKIMVVCLNHEGC